MFLVNQGMTMNKRIYIYLLLSAVTVTANIIHVPISVSSIQTGIESAVAGDTILVQPGTYFENLNFLGKQIVVGSLFLLTDDTSYISQTIINGDSLGSVVTFANGEQSATVLSGFRLTNGSGTLQEEGENFFVLMGGGIFCLESSPTLQNLVLDHNSAPRS